MNNHLGEEEVAQCADAIIRGKYGTLNSQLRNHLAICDECAAEVLSVTDITIDFNTESPKGKLARLKPWVLAASGVAAAGILFFIATGILMQTDSPVELATQYDENLPILEQTDSAIDNTITHTKEEGLAEIKKQEVMPSPSFEKPLEKISEPATGKQKPSQSYAGNYLPDETLEILFQNFTQAYRGEDIVILSKNITEIPGNDSLKWSNPAKEELYIEFFDNTGNRFLTLTKRTSGVKIPELNDGLYYWKLINKEFDLLFVGKILVE